MHIADSYFVEELRQACGAAFASAWLRDEVEKRHAKSLSPRGSSCSGDVSPRHIADILAGVAREDSWSGELICSARVNVPLQADGHPATVASSPGLTRRRMDISHRLTPGNSNSSSRNSSSSPTRASSRLATSSDYIRTNHACPSGVQGDKGDEEANSMASRQRARIQSMLRAGSQNAGLIYTDAAHLATDLEHELELEALELGDPEMLDIV